MSKELSLVLEEGVALQTGPGMARLVVDAEGIWDLDIDDIGRMSEWLAVAWENLAGEEYKPVILSERGYVAQESELAFDRVNLERDCE